MLTLLDKNEKALINFRDKIQERYGNCIMRKAIAFMFSGYDLTDINSANFPDREECISLQKTCGDLRLTHKANGDHKYLECKIEKKFTWNSLCEEIQDYRPPHVVNGWFRNLTNCDYLLELFCDMRQSKDVPPTASSYLLATDMRNHKKFLESPTSVLYPGQPKNSDYAMIGLTSYMQAKQPNVTYNRLPYIKDIIRHVEGTYEINLNSAIDTAAVDGMLSMFFEKAAKLFEKPSVSKAEKDALLAEADQYFQDNILFDGSKLKFLNSYNLWKSGFFVCHYCLEKKPLSEYPYYDSYETKAYGQDIFGQQTHFAHRSEYAKIICNSCVYSDVYSDKKN